MSFFRSQQMSYYNLIIPRESAWLVMNELGELDCIHLVDYDPTLPLISRPFASNIRRCDDTLISLNLISHQMKSFKKPLVYCGNPKELIQHFNRNLRKREKAPHSYFEEIEVEVEKKSQSLLEQIKSLQNLKEKKNEFLEYKAVLLQGNKLLGQSQNEAQKLSLDDLDDMKLLTDTLKFNQMVGVIKKEDEQRFKRLVFRVTKGNVWINILDIEQPKDAKDQIVDPVEFRPLFKCVYVIIYQGMTGQDGLIKNKLQKICEAFNSAQYEFPSSQGDHQVQYQKLEDQLRETNNLIQLTEDQIDHYLDTFCQVRPESNCSYIEELKLFVLKEKNLYANLNLMKMQTSIFCGQLWLPVGKDTMVEEALRSVHEKYDHSPSGQIQNTNPPTNKPPPTYFKLNDFTWGFQEIVNTYGIPRYREINPGLFASSIFPFLFAVMFGDIGHGGLLFILGIYLCFWKQTIEEENQVFKPLLIVRYMILMMGFFAFYIGWIYNDYLSMSLNVFGSCYEVNNNEWIREDGCTYPFGIDPVWSMSPNQLTFVNSYKMKLAVILGVLHMLLGIVLKGINALFFNNMIDFYYEFIPQIVFLCCTFGYMDFMIVFKWLTNWEDPSQAPSVISTLIGMVLTPFEIPNPPLWGSGGLQLSIQMFLLLLAVVCVPMMLFPKPFILDAENHVQEKQHQQPEEQSEVYIDKFNSQQLPLHLEEQKSDDAKFDQQLEMAAQSPSKLVDEVHKEGTHVQQHEQHSFADLFVHQVIETIEFVLGSISNTASYLRLWALSLAHSQLAEVFYDMTLAHGVEEGGAFGFITMCLGFIVFTLVTFGVLMCMDLMECFLHALRLQWVEFQNKFYKADGYLFVPFSFADMIKQNSEPSD